MLDWAQAGGSKLQASLTSLEVMGLWTLDWFVFQGVWFTRGFAFVYFENVDDAKEAKERANGMELDGCSILVSSHAEGAMSGVYTKRNFFHGSFPL